MNAPSGLRSPPIAWLPPIGRHDQQSGAMQNFRLGSMPRESTAQMAANIGREARELRAALADVRGDLVAEPKVTAALLAHLLVSSRELLQNLLIDTARQPRRISL
jgi:hypothetical protein